MVKGIIFDIGGVLAHDVWEGMLLNKDKGLVVRYGLDSDQAFQVGKELWEVFAYKPCKNQESWIDIEKEYWSQFINRCNIDSSIEEIIDLTDDFVLPVKGMQTLLGMLKENGIDLAICSNNNEFWFHRQMTKLNLQKFFEPNKITISSRVGSSKSSSDFKMFHAAVSALNIDISECLFIDDRPEAIMQSVKYGITSILFPSHAEFGSQYLSFILQRMQVI